MFIISAIFQIYVGIMQEKQIHVGVNTLQIVLFAQGSRSITT